MERGYREYNIPVGSVVRGGVDNMATAGDSFAIFLHVIHVDVDSLFDAVIESKPILNMTR